MLVGGGGSLGTSNNSFEDIDGGSTDVEDASKGHSLAMYEMFGV